MRNLHKIICGFCMLLPFFSSCEKDLEVYGYTECGLMFNYDEARDSTYGYSFAFGPSDVVIDTVNFRVDLVGDVVDYDRPILLKQVATSVNDAQSGVHYVPFDDPSLAGKYILPADSISTSIPIVLKRDASLKQVDYNLKLTFAVNEAFSFAAEERAFRTVVIADQLLKPNNWETYCKHFFGDYGKVKHQFMIDQTGFRWDNEYVDNEIYRFYLTDQNVLFGMQYDLQNKVDEYNATHEEPLREGAEYNNVLVDFKKL